MTECSWFFIIKIFIITAIQKIEGKDKSIMSILGAILNTKDSVVYGMSSTSANKIYGRVKNDADQKNDSRYQDSGAGSHEITNLLQKFFETLSSLDDEDLKNIILISINDHAKLPTSKHVHYSNNLDDMKFAMFKLQLSAIANKIKEKRNDKSGMEQLNHIDMLYRNENAESILSFVKNINNYELSDKTIDIMVGIREGMKSILIDNHNELSQDARIKLKSIIDEFWDYYMESLKSLAKTGSFKNLLPDLNIDVLNTYDLDVQRTAKVTKQSSTDNATYTRVHETMETKNHVNRNTFITVMPQYAVNRLKPPVRTNQLAYDAGKLNMQILKNKQENKLEMNKMLEPDVLGTKKIVTTHNIFIDINSITPYLPRKNGTTKRFKNTTLKRPASELNTRTLKHKASYLKNITSNKVAKYVVNNGNIFTRLKQLENDITGAKIQMQNDDDKIKRLKKVIKDRAKNRLESNPLRNKIPSTSKTNTKYIAKIKESVKNSPKTGNYITRNNKDYINSINKNIPYQDKSKHYNTSTVLQDQWRTFDSRKENMTAKLFTKYIYAKNNLKKIPNLPTRAKEVIYDPDTLLFKENSYGKYVPDIKLFLKINKKTLNPYTIQKNKYDSSGFSNSKFKKDGRQLEKHDNKQIHIYSVQSTVESVKKDKSDSNNKTLHDLPVKFTKNIENYYFPNTNHKNNRSENNLKSNKQTEIVTISTVLKKFINRKSQLLKKNQNNSSQTSKDIEHDLFKKFSDKDFFKPFINKSLYTRKVDEVKQSASKKPERRLLNKSIESKFSINDNTGAEKTLQNITESLPKFRRKNLNDELDVQLATYENYDGEFDWPKFYTSNLFFEVVENSTATPGAGRRSFADEVLTSLTHTVSKATLFPVTIRPSEILRAKEILIPADVGGRDPIKPRKVIKFAPISLKEDSKVVLVPSPKGQAYVDSAEALRAYTVDHLNFDKSEEAAVDFDYIMSETLASQDRRNILLENQQKKPPFSGRRNVKTGKTDLENLSDELLYDPIFKDLDKGLENLPIY